MTEIDHTSPASLCGGETKAQARKRRIEYQRRVLAQQAFSKVVHSDKIEDLLNTGVSPASAWVVLSNMMLEDCQWCGSFDPKTGRFDGTISGLSRVTWMSDRTVRRVIRLLEARGRLTVERLVGDALSCVLTPKLSATALAGDIAAHEEGWWDVVEDDSL